MKQVTVPVTVLRKIPFAEYMQTIDTNQAVKERLAIMSLALDDDGLAKLFAPMNGGIPKKAATPKAKAKPIKVETVIEAWTANDEEIRSIYEKLGDTPRKTADLAEALGWEKENVYAALKILEKHGVASSVGKGRGTAWIKSPQPIAAE
jgi:predicted Rossmann fold nucleotide-binding protein DprA/Smf involved in DNA uptake